MGVVSTRLLQNPYMAIHPPSLYTGFVGMTIPFAFAMAALITGYLDDSWLRAVRRWTMVSWLFLSLGLTLGMIWAYEELGWGGFWGWDPVENAGALPWFTATAFLHSVMVQERRSMLRVWNMTLVILTFFLTIFGTFMTRSGIVQSVHAFGEDPELMVLFSIFMGVILIFSFGWLIYRLPLLRARNELESWASREAAFLLNNWVLLFSAFFILFATMFPTISEAVTGQRITVGPPFFNKWMVPIGLVLLLLTGIGPLLAWRRSSLGNLVYQFAWPVGLAVATALGLAASGFRVWVSGLCFALCAFVLGTLGQEFVRGAQVRRGSTGTDFVTAIIGLVMRSRRRYGGYVVHVGIVLMFLGFAGTGYKLDRQVLMNPGDVVEIGRFTVQHERLIETDDGQKQMVTAHMVITKDGQPAGDLYPARWFFRKHETEPTTEVAIRRSIAEDLYITLATYTLADQSAAFQITVNPLVNWIWFGFTIMALGTGIALLPESSFAFMASKIPAGAATTSVLVLALALGAMSSPVHAQYAVPGGAELTPEQQTLETELQHELVCVCGSCSHLPLSQCTCGTADAMRLQLNGQVAQGKGRDDVYQHFISTYGSQEPLGAPIGAFNQLSWLFPMLVGGTFLLGVGVVAVRWSRREPERQDAPAQPADEQLEARLDDELRNLD